MKNVGQTKPTKQPTGKDKLPIEVARALYKALKHKSYLIFTKPSCYKQGNRIEEEGLGKSYRHGTDEYDQELVS